LKDHLKRQIEDFLVSLERQFDTMQIEVGGIDFSVWKIHLQARSYPDCCDKFIFYPDLNIEFRVIPLNTMIKRSTVEGLTDDDEDDEAANAAKLKELVLTNEVKKVGVIIDRGQNMEFRPGDELIVYVSMGGFEK